MKLDLSQFKDFADGKIPTFSELGFASEKEMMDDYNSAMRDMSLVGYNGYTNEHLAFGPSYDEWMKQFS